MSTESELLELADRLVAGCPSPALLVAAGGNLLRINPSAAALLGTSGDGRSPLLRDVLGIGWREISVIVGEAQTDLVIDLPPSSPLPRRRGARVRLEPIHAASGALLAAAAFLRVADSWSPASRAQPASDIGFDALFGSDPALLATKQAAARFARTPLPILLLAETGTGKELLARAIHAASARRDQPFVAINCGALSPHLLESELFGYAPGAFTGASRDGNEGKIGAARGGTLFLDEVAEMPGPLQALMLRVLEDGTYYRVGDSRPRQADVRLICATCRDLPRLVSEGSFRQDLYYRINGACLGLPTVRQRRDFRELTEHLLESLAGQQHRATPTIAPEVMRWMASLPWAGNVRQLKTSLQYALILCDGDEIRSDHLPLEPAFDDAGHRSTPADPGANAGADHTIGVRRTLAEREVERLQRVVEESNGNLSRAAAELGIARSTLYRRLRRHGLVQ